jgi:hypothetical protein
MKTKLIGSTNLASVVDELRASGISDEIAERRGVRRVSTEEAKALGFAGYQARDGIYFPLYGTDGRNGTGQLKPDEPRVREGKPVKYETVAGSGIAVDLHPSMRDKAMDLSVPLFITEGVKKADALASRGYPCLALFGVYGWNEPGTKRLRKDFDAVPLRGRTVYLAFDMDLLSNPKVRRALDELKAAL